MSILCLLILLSVHSILYGMSHACSKTVSMFGKNVFENDDLKHINHCMYVWPGPVDCRLYNMF